MDFPVEGFRPLIYHRVKLARAGVGGNFCVLKHFYDTSPMWMLIREEGDKQKEPTITGSGEQITETKGSLNFGRIDAFHLADLNLLRGRITKLLLNSPNHTHVTKDLAITLVSLQNLALIRRIHRSPRDLKTQPKQNAVSSALG